ncbi:MAG: TIM barrel protein, partial [Acidobacteriaceae bacterium]
RCNARHLTLLPGVTFDQESYNDSVQRSSEELAWRIEAARKVGVTLAIEAHLGSIVPLPEQARHLLDMTTGLTLTLDYGHFTRQGIPDEEIEPLVPFASHLHARCGRQGRLQASLRENTIDFVRIVRSLEQHEYTGFITLEYVWIDWEQCNEVDNLSETILLRNLLQSADTKNSAS